MTHPVTQAPGFYRHQIGPITVTTLNDGFLPGDAGMLTGIDPTTAATALGEAFLPPAPVVTVNAFLLHVGSVLVLIDAGCGNGMGPTGGRLLENLQHAGVTPGEIGLILLTHMHPDHLGGLLDPEGRPVFAQARLMAPEADAAVFLDAELAKKVPEQAQPVFAKARAVATAYAGRFERFGDAAELAPGVRAVSLPGHSPGHTGFWITGGDQTLLVWGDVVHVPGLQFSLPDVGVVFDADSALAQQTRRDTFAAAATGRYLVAGMHMPFPGLAHVVADGAAYRQVPIVWSAGFASAAPAV